MADISITAANVVASSQAITEWVTAGATITAGQYVYIDPADGRAKLADADAGSATLAAVYGVALNGGASGQRILVCKEDPDFTPGGTLSLSGAGDDGIYVLSGTAGGICPAGDLAAADYPVFLGIAKSTTKMKFKPVYGTAVLT